MRTKLFLILCVGLLPAVDAADEDAAKKDLERMQGDWALASYVIDEAKLSDDEAQSLFRTIKGDQYTVFLFDKAIFKGTFKIDAGKKPKTLDSFAAGMPDKPVLAIYEIDGDTLKICSAAPGKERPPDFTAKKNSGHSLMIWEREKKK
jgi:uncharacterized protein (TIGR03067 family)